MAPHVLAGYPVTVASARYLSAPASKWTARIMDGQAATKTEARGMARAVAVALAGRLRAWATVVAVFAWTRTTMMARLAAPSVAKYGLGASGLACLDVSAFQAASQYGWGPWVGMLVTGLSLIVADAWVSMTRMESPADS
jgi:hypothetical protein